MGKGMGGEAASARRREIKGALRLPWGVMNEGMNERKVRHRDTLVYWNTLMATIAPRCLAIPSSSLVTHRCKSDITRLSCTLKRIVQRI